MVEDVYTCTHIPMYMHTYPCTCTCMYRYMYTCISIRTCTHKYTGTNAYSYTTYHVCIHYLFFCPDMHPYT